jgi:hypothetical protein
VWCGVVWCAVRNVTVRLSANFIVRVESYTIDRQDRVSTRGCVVCVCVCGVQYERLCGVCVCMVCSTRGCVVCVCVCVWCAVRESVWCVCVYGVQ